MARFFLLLSTLIVFQGHSIIQECTDSSKRWINWNRTYSGPVHTLYIPESEEELLAIVKQAYKMGKKIRVLGSGHSSNDISLPEEDTWVISLEKYQKILEIDRNNQTITVQAGITLNQINDSLREQNLALENLGSISAPTISGVIQTGTHGTGIQYGPIHTQVISMTVINGKGELEAISLTKNPELFRAYQCGLGCLGVVSTVTLQTVPTRFLHEKTFPSKWPDVLDQLNELIHKNEYIRIYWFPYINLAGIWTANQSNEDYREKAPGPLQSIFSRDTSYYSQMIEHVSQELNNTGIQNLEDILEINPSDPKIISFYNQALYDADYRTNFERVDYSDRILNIDCGSHANSCAIEIAVPLQFAKSFFLDFQNLIEENYYPAHTGIEIRFVKADNAYLSLTNSKNPEDLFCFASIVSIQPNGKPLSYEPYFEAIHHLAENYGGRTHWGKMGIYEPQTLKKNYPYFEDFKKIRKQQDPKGIFLNRLT